MLAVDRLGVRAGELDLVTEVSFTVSAGERVGLIGESGSGKSLTATALLGLLPEELTASGSVRVAGVEHELVGAPERLLTKLRGSRLAMVFQEPMTALNPAMRVIDQVAEAREVHHPGRDRVLVEADALRLLEQVRLPEVATLARAYPHQLSGGQRQRVLLAMALANDPDVLVCDEPTTALDVTVQAQLLELILAGVAERGAALLFITHDLAVVATVCERVLVMYGGRVVEAGPVREVLTEPRHHYTRGLLDASDLESTDEHGRLHAIPGTVPAAGEFPSGCVFRTRCGRADEQCADLPPWTGVPDHGHACWHPVGGDS
ncbi:ABC transporter ATP-binding protein [Kutzneria viridogrisea]|uniref:Oligopeptide/dipeptide ABC transporter ATP-binding protein n=1 Tax=Kutzneria viridogrisea TaxID=47990 RepID=A0ABR6BFP2_9PSEU|nr:oligopeptide/dipeptide ABC transporter ATP-binding protein [Kutzneria viridogrisea]